MRQKILFESQEGEDPLKYDAGHIQQLFRRTVETGLQDDSIRTKLRPFLSNPVVEYGELIHQLNAAVLAEEEGMKKLKNQSKGKSPTVSQISQESPEPTKVPPGKEPTPREDPKSTDSVKSDLQERKAAVEALKTEVKTRPGTTPQPEQGRGNRWSSGRGQGRREVRPRPPKVFKLRYQRTPNDKLA